MNLATNDIHTTAKDWFLGEDSARLAYLIYRRFGKEIYPAHNAWCRCLQNNSDLPSFEKMVKAGELIKEFEMEVIDSVGYTYAELRNTLIENINKI
jgi:hypothetical protein